MSSWHPPASSASQVHSKSSVAVNRWPRTSGITQRYPIYRSRNNERTVCFLIPSCSLRGLNQSAAVPPGAGCALSSMLVWIPQWTGPVAAPASCLSFVGYMFSPQSRSYLDVCWRDCGLRLKLPQRCLWIPSTD